MSMRRTICLVLIIASSIYGLSVAGHLVKLHYSNPKHKLVLIDNFHFMERWFPRKQVEADVNASLLPTKTEQIDPFKNPEFDPYQNAIQQKPDEKKEKTQAKKGDCEISKIITCVGVDNTKYSHIRGVSIGAIGFAGYSLTILLCLVHLVRRRQKSDIFSLALYACAWFGLGFTIYLTWIEAFVIHMFCPYCLRSAGVVAATFILTLIGFGFEPVAMLFAGKRNQ